VRILLVGGGAREHALAWRIARSPSLTKLWVAPGNYGTARIAANLGVGSSVDTLVQAARDVRADLVVVGPEAPLADGLVDALSEFGIPAFGPTRAAAQLESSKSFARQIIREANAPGPEFAVFTDESEALEYLRLNPGPRVVKADGLAAGKGVVAADAVRASMSARAFGDAGATVLLEERLEGREVSVFAFCDGERLSPLVAACDYKRLEDGDLGPNTGGMGSYSPPEFWTPELSGEVERTIMRPVIEAMASRGTPYRGVLYAGLMLTVDGPKILEFNCRFGDPETQVLMPRLASDPLPAMLACAEGRLDPNSVAWDDRRCVGVVMASGGYPDRFATGKAIEGLDEFDARDTLVFCAGVAEGPGGGPVTSGGRVLTVVGEGNSLPEARERAYSRLAGITFHGAHRRTDIAAVGARVNA
ncbi:Phosphoribosylamine--glycine ligase, partial [Geodia barretti]